MNKERSLHITIDIDTLGCYGAIHDLALKERDIDAVYEDAMPRFLEICRAEKIKATLFVIAKDLENARHQTLIKKAFDEGHEIASHSYSHNYALSQLSPAEIEADLTRANAIIKDTTGKYPLGFRAPGYNQSENLMHALSKLGFGYDSSYFPVPLYFAARKAAIAHKRFRKKYSKSLAGNWREFAVSQRPFYPLKSDRFRGNAHKSSETYGFLEIPMSAPLNLPLIGTSMAVDFTPFSRMLARLGARSKSPLNLEFHAIDFLDPQHAPAILRAYQPDLQVGLPTKIKRLVRVIKSVHKDRRALRLQSLIP